MPRSSKRERACKGDGRQEEGCPAAKANCCQRTKSPSSVGASSCDEAPDYSSMSVWDKRYQDGVFVEWYCGFNHVLPLFERFVPKDSRVLDVGCGDKPLAYDMRDAGYTGQITSFDFSPTVIEKLLEESRSCDRKRLERGVEFRVLDARKLPFAAGSFDLVVDKGTVDAMLCDNAGKDSARAICREAARVVAPGGWFVIVSHIHPSTAEGMELLSETLVPALQDSSSSVPSGRTGSEDDGEGEEDREEFSWSVDVHCGGDGEEEEEDGEEEEEGGGVGSQGESERGSDASGDGSADEGCRRGGVEQAGDNEEGRGGDDDSSAGGQVGPSAYMARKVPRRRTRSSAARGQSTRQPQRAIPIRIHEY